MYMCMFVYVLVRAVFSFTPVLAPMCKYVYVLVCGCVCVRARGLRFSSGVSASVYVCV